MDEAEAGRVGRRRVFYIPGYDPFHPRRYRELYRKEGAAQAALSGYALSLSAPRGGSGHGWNVAAETGGEKVAAEIEVLVWSDLVRASMGQSIAATYGQLLRTAWIYIASGALFRLIRLRKGPAIAALYPIVALLVQLGVALALGGIVWRIGAALGVGLAGGLAGLALAYAVLAGFRRIDGRLYAYYLMHDYAHSAQLAGACPPDLAARLGVFGDAVARALTEEWDEVLVVGHSTGAHLAVTVLADLIRAGRVPATGPALGLLTLGQVAPMVAFLPRAQKLRGDLAYLSARDELTWVDVTAPGDGCAYALCDPVAVTGVAPAGKRWPLVVSAAFTQTLSPERWRALRWRFFRLHFQYLCAFDALAGGPGDYDYFQITAGPLTLAARYAGRAASKSRVETPMSGYRDIA